MPLVTEEDWRRAASAVVARMSELRLTAARLAELAEVDAKTVGNFLDRGMKPRTSSRGGYEKALGWAYGSLTRVARGEEPVQAAEPEAAVGASLDPELLAELSDSRPEEQQRVLDYLRGIKAGRDE